MEGTDVGRQMGEEGLENQGRTMSQQEFLREDGEPWYMLSPSKSNLKKDEVCRRVLLRRLWMSIGAAGEGRKWRDLDSNCTSSPSLPLS